MGQDPIDTFRDRYLGYKKGQIFTAIRESSVVKGISEFVTRDLTKTVKLVVIALFIIAAGCLIFVNRGQKAFASALGPSPSHTNAPDEDNCTECHVDFPVNSGTGSVRITGLPLSYLPGQQVPITVTTSQEDGVVYGFQLTSIDSTGRAAGTWTLADPEQTKIIPGTVGPNVRQYVEHTQSGIIPTVFGSKTWSLTWTAPQRRVGKVGFYAAGNAANGDGDTGGDYIYTTRKGVLAGAAAADLDGDQVSEIGVFRPANGAWYSYNIATGAVQTQLFGLPEDLIAPADYDGDGKTDYAVFRPSTGTWYIQRSTRGFVGIQFGASGDMPVAGDYDGDGKADVAVFRPSTGVWYLLQSSAGFAAIPFGLNGDKPAQGDYDADGKTDIAVYRPSNGTWYLLQSTAGFAGIQFGIAEDRPVQADYDGDGQADIAVFRPSTGSWYFMKSSEGFAGVNFGLPTDLPAPADFDGDGKGDIAVFRPSTGTWYLTRSGDNSFYALQFGINGDVPIAAGYIAR